MNENNLHYLAGYFDGEGTATTRMVKSSKNGKRYKRLEARITQKDPATLHWIRDELGYGRVQSCHHKDKICFEYCVYYAQARKFLLQLHPYLRGKSLQVENALRADGAIT